MFEVSTLFTLASCAHIFGPISLISGFLHARKMFSLLESDQETISHVSTFAHFSNGRRVHDGWIAGSSYRWACMGKPSFQLINRGTMHIDSIS